jgi:hypothetical protein
MRVIAILFAMAGLITALVVLDDRDDHHAARIWGPLQRDVNVSDNSYQMPASIGARPGNIQARP